MFKSQELNRVQKEYARREKRLSGSELYSRSNPAHQFILQCRQRDMISFLHDHGLGSFTNMTILELGCGRGNVLKECVSNGAISNNLHGTDLLFYRVQDAHEEIPQIPLTCSNGEYLPYASNSFEMILQFTVFTSILDPNVKSRVASEMLRVLRKPNGAILWYDFWLNPTNMQTRGIRPKEIRDLFPNCSYIFRKITLAPPIARRMVPISWALAERLEKLEIFNSHYLALIQPL